jgi:putative ABC transport system permease protein
MIIVLILSLPFLFILLRRPVLRRLAIRNSTRRPRETVLVVLGSLLGTAIMTGSFVVGDTFNSSIRREAHTQLGPVDEVVSASGHSDIAARLAGFTDPNVDGVLPLTLTRAAIATTGPDRRAAAKAQLLETDFAQARRFGGDAGATGISGPTPAPGEAVIGHDLANALNVKKGDQIEAFAYDNKVLLKVARVLPKLGVAGFWRGTETASNNAFVAPGTIQQLVAGGRSGVGTPPQSLVLVSNRGGVESGAKLTDEVTQALDARLAGVQHSVDNVKQTVIERADASGKSLSRLYTSIGSFAVLAGILLLVNIFFMLADERKSELGMLRAVGLRRSSLIGAFATEGWCYAVASAVLGTFAGLALGRALMAAAASLFSSRTNDDRLSLHFAFQWSSVTRGLVIGFVIALVTILGTSFWLSRFNIIQAIRDINEPARRRPRRRTSYIGFAVAAMGLVLFALGLGNASFLAMMLGPVLVFFGITPTLARMMPRRTAVSIGACVVLVWAVAAVPIAMALGGNVDVILFVIQGLVLVGAAVVLVSQHQSAIGHAIGRLANRSLRVRLGLAYPLARRFRTSMTLGMFALVVFILVMVSVFSAMFGAQLGGFTRDISGGYNVVVDSNPSNPVPFNALARDPGVRAVAPLVTAPVQVTKAPGLKQSRVWEISSFDKSFLDHGAPKIDDRGSYPSDKAAYDDVLANPKLAIIDKFFLARGGGPPAQSVGIGDPITVVDPIGGGEKTYTVAAIAPNDFVENGILVGTPAMKQLVGNRAIPSRAYVQVDDPTSFVAQFSGQYLQNGGRADTLRSIVQSRLSNQQQFFLLMRGYLALGLIVGIAGIGVIMVRAVRERRRQVGVLRALGFQAKAVRAAFVVESAFVAVEGVVLGTVLALVCAWSMTLTDGFGGDIAFRVPITSILILVIGTLVCSLLATAAPARSAAKIDPAVALRIAD